jgi:hypothetical protein
MIYVACIGTRRIKIEDEIKCAKLGAALAAEGVTVTSGNAFGSDQAFGQGVNKIDPSKLMLYLPWSRYERDAVRAGNIIAQFPSPQDTPRWYAIAEENHPAWGNCTDAVRRLHARNSGIIAGPPRVSCVLAQRGADHKGGTEQGIRIALSLGIRVIDVSTLSFDEIWTPLQGEIQRSAL